jgi:hypothetical protein
MDYGFSKHKLPGGYSYPLKRSMLDLCLEKYELTKISFMYYSFHHRSDQIILQADYFGETHKGWAAAGLSSISVQAVPSEKRKEIESVILDNALPALCDWLKKTENEGDGWRASSRYLVFRYIEGKLIGSNS